jgi:hypothetical protein
MDEEGILERAVNGPSGRRKVTSTDGLQKNSYYLV